MSCRICLPCDSSCYESCMYRFEQLTTGLFICTITTTNITPSPSERKLKRPLYPSSLAKLLAACRNKNVIPISPLLRRRKHRNRLSARHEMYFSLVSFQVHTCIHTCTQTYGHIYRRKNIIVTLNRLFFDAKYPFPRVCCLQLCERNHI